MKWQLKEGGGGGEEMTEISSSRHCNIMFVPKQRVYQLSSTFHHTVHNNYCQSNSRGLTLIESNSHLLIGHHKK